jgi:hypothetical protein
MAFFSLANLHIKDTTYKEIKPCTNLQYNNTARPKISTTGIGSASGTSIPGRAEPDDVSTTVIYDFADVVHQLLDGASSDTEYTFRFTAQDGSSTMRYFKGKISQWPKLPTIAENQAAQKSLQILVTAPPQSTDFA